MLYCYKALMLDNLQQLTKYKPEKGQNLSIIGRAKSPLPSHCNPYSKNINPNFVFSTFPLTCTLQFRAQGIPQLRPASSPSYAMDQTATVHIHLPRQTRENGGSQQLSNINNRNLRSLTQFKLCNHTQMI